MTDSRSTKNTSTIKEKVSEGAISNLSKVVVAVRSREKRESFALYWIVFPAEETSNKSAAGDTIAAVLSDELLESVWLDEQAVRADLWPAKFADEGFAWFAEKQYLPGVTDNLAHTIEEALHLDRKSVV